MPKAGRLGTTRSMGEAAPNASGRQELLENVANRYVSWTTTPLPPLLESAWA